MAYVTKMPQTSEIVETEDAINFEYIKTKPPKQSKTLPKPTSINVKPKKPDHPSNLQTQLFSDVKNEQGKLVKNIDMKDMFPHSPTSFAKNLIPSVSINNLDSLLQKPLYPYEAYQNNINGWVLLKLYISIVGKVVNVEVLDSSPKGIFENNAVKAAYKKEFPIDKNNLDPKAHTKNIKIKYDAMH